MDDLKGMLSAINALGEKINALEDDLRYAGYRVDNLVSENAKLTEENAKLKSTIAKVQNFCDGGNNNGYREA